MEVEEADDSWSAGVISKRNQQHRVSIQNSKR